MWGCEPRFKRCPKIGSLGGDGSFDFDFGDGINHFLMRMKMRKRMKLERKIG